MRELLLHLVLLELVAREDDEAAEPCSFSSACLIKARPKEPVAPVTRTDLPERSGTVREKSRTELIIEVMCLSGHWSRGAGAGATSHAVDRIRCVGKIPDTD